MKTNLKKILSAILAISAVISASGCNIVTEEDPSSQNNSSQVQDNPQTPESSASGENSSQAESTPAPQSSISPQSSSKPQSSSSPDNEEPGGEMSGTVFVLSNGRGISLFGGGKAGGKDYAETLNTYKEKLGDVKLYSLVAPTSGSYYLPAKYKNKMASEKDNIDHINSFLSGVTPIDAYSVLAKHTDEDIYFRTDHHWTQLGAYYAAEEFARVAGVPFAPLSEYNTTVREGFVGSLYGYSKENAKMRKNPDTFTFYKPKNNYTISVYDPKYNFKYKMPFRLTDDVVSLNNSYMVYGGDAQINYVKTDCTNGRKLVIIGDSYDNAFFPNLTNSFSEIWVVDMRAVTSSYTYFDLNIIDFIQKMGATDELFCMDTFSAVGGNRKGLKTMLNSANTLELS